MKRAAPGRSSLRQPVLPRHSEEYFPRMAPKALLRAPGGETDSHGHDALSKAKEAVRGYDALLTDTYVKGQEGGTGLTLGLERLRGHAEGHRALSL